MRLRLLSFALALGLISTLIAAPLAANAAPPTTHTLTQPVTGTIANGGGTFAGTLNITQFAAQNGQVVAIGTLTGTLTNAAGQVIGTVTDVPVTLPVAPCAASQILHLALGPLDLNLLGLMVHLNEVVLDISAQPGSGNLLGNLLSAVAHLLDSNASTTALANLLNHILGAL